MIVEIIRLDTSKNYGTFGVMKIDKSLFCYTLENPWVLNKRNVSCIPAGQYNCSKHESFKFGHTFIVEDVPDRSNILFHKMNIHTETEGCIGLGMMIGHLGTVRAILNSGEAFQHFMNMANGRRHFKLSITEKY